MRFRRPILGFAVFLSILIAVGLILPAINSALWRWPQLACRFNDVDINTGRIRQTRYLLYCKVSEKIEDSILTRTIGQFPDGLQPDWRHVNTFLPGKLNSPHHAYHGAIGQIRKVESIWQLCSFSDEAKKHITRTILDKWQSGRNYFAAERYINDVWDIAREKTEANPKVIISVADLTSIPNKQ